MKTNNEKVWHLEKKGLDYNSYQSVVSGPQHLFHLKLVRKGNSLAPPQTY